MTKVMCCIGNEKATLGGPWYRESPRENFSETQKIPTYFDSGALSCLVSKVTWSHFWEFIAPNLPKALRYGGTGIYLQGRGKKNHLQNWKLTSINMKTDKIENQDAVFCCYEQSFEVLLSVFRNVFTFGKSHSAPISFTPRVYHTQDT